MMLNRVLQTGAAVALAVAASWIPARAADLPCGTAKLIVPWSAGGDTDVVFRIFADQLSQQGAEPGIQVVNVTGQGGNKGAKEARAAKPDGCTLFAIHQSAITSYFTGRVDFHWNAFQPVALLTHTPAIVGASPKSPYKTFSDVVKTAKAKPGTILVGATLGSTSHFVFLLIEDKADIKFKYVPYDGTAQRMTALLASNIELGEINLAAAEKHVKTGALKALGISSAKRDPNAPEIPTLRELGVDLVYGTDRGIMLPKETPKEIVDHWARVFQTAAKDPDLVAQFTRKGTEVQFLGPDEYRNYWEETFATWKKIAQKVGMYKGD